MKIKDWLKDLWFWLFMAIVIALLIYFLVIGKV
jgi:hypothetical protein